MIGRCIRTLGAAGQGKARQGIGASSDATRAPLV